MGGGETVFEHNQSCFGLDSNQTGQHSFAQIVNSNTMTARFSELSVPESLPTATTVDIHDCDFSAGKFSDGEVFVETFSCFRGRNPDEIGELKALLEELLEPPVDELIPPPNSCDSLLDTVKNLSMDI